MTPEEQRDEIRAIIAYYDARGLDWLDVVAYHGAVFTGRWPIPRPERKPRKVRAHDRADQH